MYSRNWINGRLSCYAGTQKKKAAEAVARSGTKTDKVPETDLPDIENEEAEAEGLDGLDELVSGRKKSHGPGWLIGRHDVKCLTASTRDTAPPAPTNTYVQELTKKIRQKVAEEVEAMLNQKIKGGQREARLTNLSNFFLHQRSSLAARRGRCPPCPYARSATGYWYGCY
ncbi:hypothetical protein POM88_045129 [Heracleum sosnowskyi]|uniref:Uncharacterized protein n=1 Tax=Heracleum sosnowskyi TaxID=360622 RepID=A0AAD8H6T3_9APIA|nr:hypothetical protein POM88_045129 [Heracleum sosnowskyi]